MLDSHTGRSKGFGFVCFKTSGEATKAVTEMHLKVREEQVYLAKLAEWTERYCEMTDYMKDVARYKIGMSVEECNLMLVACKNEMGSCRASWRSVSSVEQREHSNGNPENVKLARMYRTKVEDELDKISQRNFRAVVKVGK